MVRGTVILPHGTGKTARVIVFATGPAAEAAIAAGADEVGGVELIEKVAGGYTAFDSAVSTPELMGQVGRLGKVLGPRGLMPNPKTGTVTPDVAKAVSDIKGGKIEFRVDKHANVHFVIGKAGFSAEQLGENIKAALDEIQRSKPSLLEGPLHPEGVALDHLRPGYSARRQRSLVASRERGRLRSAPSAPPHLAGPLVVAVNRGDFGRVHDQRAPSPDNPATRPGSRIRRRTTGRATPPRLRAVAAVTFPLACPPHTTDEAMAAFIAGNLTETHFTGYLADPERELLLAEVDGVPAGYTMLVVGEPADPDVAAAITTRPTAELSKCLRHARASRRRSCRPRSWRRPSRRPGPRGVAARLARRQRGERAREPLLREARLRDRRPQEVPGRRLATKTTTCASWSL